MHKSKCFDTLYIFILHHIKILLNDKWDILIAIFHSKYCTCILQLLCTCSSKNSDNITEKKIQNSNYMYSYMAALGRPSVQAFMKISVTFCRTIIIRLRVALPYPTTIHSV